jgi:hypothetical protein
MIVPCALGLAGAEEEVGESREKGCVSEVEREDGGGEERAGIRKIAARERMR